MIFVKNFPTKVMDRSFLKKLLKSLSTSKGVSSFGVGMNVNPILNSIFSSFDSTYLERLRMKISAHLTQFLT